MRNLPNPTGALILSAALASFATASDLKIDGQTSVTKAIGSSVQVDLTGNPGLPAVLWIDVSAGPSTFLGESLPLGLTPALSFQFMGLTNAGGVASMTTALPNSPGLIGKQFFTAGAIADPADANGWDLSNGADLTLTGAPSDVIAAELAGNSLNVRPHFEFVRAINLGSSIEVSIDPLDHPSLVGQPVDLYVVDPQTAAGWDANPALVDLTAGGAETVTISGAGVQANRFVVDNGSLSGPSGTDLARGYDVIIDVDQDGQLSAGDLIDGYGDTPGIHVVRDTTQPGPYAVTEATYSGGTFLGQNTFYPTNIATLGQLPLVVISHGNGHNYQWYDHIGNNLASYGFVVMSHQNNTGPGIETASTTTLTNTEGFLGSLASIEGGVMNGHVDSSNITWIGHSRGGEGVARAYDRIVDGSYVPVNFSIGDIKLISSIAPTDFLGVNSANPHGVPYHLWVGQSDSDVSGCPSSNVTQSFHLLDRATNQSQSTSLKGVGHAWFHNGGGNTWATGPCLIGQAKAHAIELGYLLPLVKHHMLGDYAARDFLTRQYEAFHPISVILPDPCVGVDLQYTPAIESGKFVIDDFQTFPAVALASSGATVSSDLLSYSEGRLDDGNTNFTNLGTDPFNGFTQGSNADSTAGIVFAFNSNQDYNLTYDLLPADQDWTSFRDLSFRACQVTRHGNTIATLGDADFEVELVDGNGNSSVISILATGAGLTEPYQRTSCGTGTGWGNEFETIRLDLNGFTADDANFDLSNVDKLIFRFGPSHGSPEGRFGLDDIELTSN